MLETLRRVVTGHNAEHRSVVWLDGPPGNILEVGGHGVGEIWACGCEHPSLAGDSDPAKAPIRLEPQPGDAKFRYFIVPPECRDLSPAQKAEAEAFQAAAFASIGAEHCRVDTGRHSAMHKTETLDFIVVVRGPVSLLLDEGEVDLEAGDVVVQRATNHGWVNRGSDTALLVGVLIDARNVP